MSEGSTEPGPPEPHLAAKRALLLQGSDIEAGASPRRAKRPAKRTRPSGRGESDLGDLPSGPTSYESIFEFADDIVKNLAKLIQAAVLSDKNLIKSLQKGGRLFVTTSYSGIGSGEWAVRFVERALKKILGINITVVIYAACDNDARCQRVLSAHDTPPLHRFRDLRERLAEAAYEELEGLYFKYRVQLPEKGSVTITEYYEACDRIGQQFLDEALEYLDKCDVADVVADDNYCFVCKKRCSLARPAS